MPYIEKMSWRGLLGVMRNCTDLDLKQMDIFVADIYISLASKQNDLPSKFNFNDWVPAEWNDSFGCFKKLILIKIIN